MKNALRYILSLLTSVFLLWSCQKETSIDTGTATPDNPAGNNGGNTAGNYGWSFTAPSNTDYHGCVDTAYYEVTSGIKTLAIEGTDSAGNEFILTLASPSGSFSPTTYTPASGAAMAVSAGFDAYAATTASSFSLNVTTVNDTLIEGTFTANLESVSGGTTLSIANGKLKALIGKSNPCSSSTPDNGGGTPDPNADADFELASSGSTCSNANVEGLYWVNTDLDGSNQVTLDVDVTSAGNWTLSTNTTNGITFSGSGTFAFPGLQSITLQASGKPLAGGTTTFPISSGGSNCSFSVAVDDLPVAPCNPTNNSVAFSTAGITDFTFTSVYTTVSDTYNLTGNGSGGDIELTFAGNNPPVEGVYDIRPVAGSIGPKEVSVYLVASDILWQASSGKLYVSKVNGKVVATFCDVPFSGTLGGPSFNTNVTAKMTQD